ncbi:unnamed protein product [Schistosoma turkestanicum]|nr:unnamed protein product [Schistosoma turkestanicum]
MLQHFRLLRNLPKLAHTYISPLQSLNKQQLISSHNILNFKPKAAEIKFFLPDVVRLTNLEKCVFEAPTFVSAIRINKPIALPSLPDVIPIELKNDFTVRRRKMKKHQKKRLRKRHAVLLRKLQMMREKKEEGKLQQLLEFWRIRSEAWDPSDKIKKQLHFARRSGYYIDILNTKGSPFFKE